MSDRFLLIALSLCGCVPAPFPKDTAPTESAPSPGDSGGTHSGTDDSTGGTDDSHTTDDTSGDTSDPTGHTGETGRPLDDTGPPPDDSATDSTPPLDTGSSDTTIGLTDLDCTGAKDDGRAIKICGNADDIEVGSIFSGACDLDADGNAELYVGNWEEGSVMRVDDLSSSGTISTVVITSDVDESSLGLAMACGGDRDDDEYVDLAVGDGENGWLDASLVYVFDGPVTDTVTTGSAGASLGMTKYLDANAITWVAGVGDEGGDGVIYGSAQPGDVDIGYYPTAYYEPNPEGSIQPDDIHARINSEGDEGFYIGQVVRSADIDADGVLTC